MSIFGSQKISLKARALRYLSAREHSRAELKRKLTPYAEHVDSVDLLLDQLEAAKFLSDERFSESLINRRASRFGNQRILAELQQHKIDPETVSQLKHDLEKNEVLRAQQVWEKKFPQLPTDRAERAQHIRFLSQRGFSQNAIQKILRGNIEEEWE